MEEIWKDIKGYEGKYQVSNLGEVRSLKFNKSQKCKKLKPKFAGAGYRSVALLMNGKSKYCYIHRLVALHFIDNPLFKKEVNHKDGDRSNNILSNLEWCTHSENGIHSFRILNRIPSDVSGFKNPKSKLTEEQVVEIRKQYANGKSYRSLSILFKVSKCTISSIILRQTWVHI